EDGEAGMGVAVAGVSTTHEPALEWWKRSPLTNDRGEFRLSVGPGRYYILAGSSGLVDRGPDLVVVHSATTYESTYHDTYYPGVTALGEATAVEAKPGSEISGLGIRLARTPALNRSGAEKGRPQ